MIINIYFHVLYKNVKRDNWTHKDNLKSLDKNITLIIFQIIEFLPWTFIVINKEISMHMLFIILYSVYRMSIK